MEDLQTVNDIINGAVKDSSYVTVLISSGVFILYTLIIKVVDLFKAKDRNKPIIEMASAIKEVSENVVKLNQVLDKTIQDAETKEASRINNIILTAFNSFKAALLDQCIDIVIYNHIETTRDNVKQTIYKTTSTEYYKLYSIFSAYEHDSVNVATKIKEEWIDDITNECLKIIYDGAEATLRIRQLNNKLNLIIEEYSIYIKNKEFITDNITKLVSTEYYKLYSILSAYEINEVNVASKLKEEWIDNITKKCLQIIYSNQDSLTRIRQLNDRLIIITEEHSIYINNKVFNH